MGDYSIYLLSNIIVILMIILCMINPTVGLTIIVLEATLILLFCKINKPKQNKKW